ncbi:MFS transporter [Isoalcanivorax beigongshangi]|uniref:MFS transporter n=1 Tax=Isoalcanivorax beigongshangi TaxID=3238810 RepID=A0ABV4AFU5_9GAMM
MSPPSSLSPPAAGRTEWLGLAVLVLPTLLLSLDLTVLHLAVPHLVRDLHPSSNQLLWILDVYGFMVAGFLITMGALGDRWGRRRLLLWGAAAFGIASVLAALSTSATMLIITRALLGVAGATLMPSTLALIRNLFHRDDQRTVAISIWTTGFLVGGAIGPLVGGVILEFARWQTVFLLGVPVMGLLLVAGPKLLPEYRDPDAGPLDLASAVQCVLALLGWTYALKEVTRSGFTLDVIGASLLAAAATLIFVRRQQRLAQPMFDLALLSHGGFRVAVGGMMISLLAMSGAWLLVYQYLQGVQQLSPLEAGVVMLPAAVAQVLITQFVPAMQRRIRHSVLVTVSMLVAALGFVLMAGVGHGGGIGLLVVGALLMGSGLMPMMILATEQVVTSVPPEKAGVASATSETAVELGMALGIAVMGSLGARLYRDELTAALSSVLPETLLAQAGETLSAALELAPQTAEPELVVAAAEAAFSHALALNALWGAALVVVVALWLGRHHWRAEKAAGASVK